MLKEKIREFNNGVISFGELKIWIELEILESSMASYERGYKDGANTRTSNYDKFWDKTDKKINDLKNKLKP